MHDPANDDLMADLEDSILGRWVGEWFKDATIFRKEDRSARDAKDFLAVITPMWTDGPTYPRT